MNDTPAPTIRASIWWLIQLGTWPLHQIRITAPTAWSLGHRWAAQWTDSDADRLDKLEGGAS